ncbi:unnamed protein product [Tilletia caries]|nr:hypothetical protein CF335_g112 [Tilletia laevis]CAD6889107.1 unnamed protein product [Tilletia caries]CAD7062644.1 unnamed protein product [Tilletia caries]
MSTTQSRLPLTLIVAASPTNGIGASGSLPWRLPREMAYFKHLTSHTNEGEGSSKNAVLMGRNTWESIPRRFRPLGGRVNVVISRSASAEELGIDPAQDTHLFPNPSAALAYLQTRQTTHAPTPLSRIFLIGGAQLYAQALQEQQQQRQQGEEGDGQAASWNLDRLLVTRILKPAYEQCDVFLSEFRTAEQQQQQQQDASPPDESSLPREGGAQQPLSQKEWTQSSPDELEAFIGGQAVPGLDLIRGVQEEKGTKYEFQMWTRVRQ